MASVGNFSRHVALAECSSIDSSLAMRTRRHLAVHEARKAIRRLRSLLGLLSEAIGPEVALISQQLKALGDSLSRCRDLQVSLEMSKKVLEHSDAEDAKWVIQVMRDRRDTAMAEALRVDPGFTARRAEVARIAVVLDSLPWSELKARDLKKGLKKSGKRVGKSLAGLAVRPSTEEFHRTRRRARRLKMQLAMLVPSYPHLAAPMANELGAKGTRELQRLTDAIGKHRDFTMLRQRMRRVSPHQGRLAFLKALNQRCEDSKQRLHKLLAAFE